MFRCTVGPFNGAQDGLDTGRHTGRNISGSKSWHNLIPDNLSRPCIRQDSLQSVAHLYANFTILDRDEQENSVIGPLAAQLPRRRDTMGKIKQRLTL